MKGTKEQDGLKIYLRGRRDGKTLLKPSTSCQKLSGVWGYGKFVITGWSKLKMLYNIKSCLWLSANLDCGYFNRTEEGWDWGKGLHSCFLGLVLEDGKGAGPFEVHVLFGFWMIGSNAEKWYNLPKKQFFINSSDEAHLLKSCLSFGGDLEGSNEEKMGKQQKKEVL